MLKNIKDCKYCKQQYQISSRIVLENKYFIANFDNHPVSPGHMKIVSKEHRECLDHLTDAEIIALRDILKDSKQLISKKYNPDGWNIGNNEGASAGQTVFHLHIHLIPRYTGDISDPVGGVRTILPNGNYLKA